MSCSRSVERKSNPPRGLRTERELILGIHVENANRRPANRRLADNVNATPRKVIFPALPSRMEKFRDLIRLRINPRQVRSLVEITVNAGQRQIVQIITAAMESRKDVFDVKCRER